MSDLESIQPAEEGEEMESGSQEREESEQLDNTTHEPGMQVEQTQSFEEAEAIESAFTELVPDAICDAEQFEISSDLVLETPEAEIREMINGQTAGEAPSLPSAISEEEIETLQHTAVGKGPIPTYPEVLDGQEEATTNSSPLAPDAEIDLIAKVLSNEEFREQFLSNPEEALKDQNLTPEERTALAALQEKSSEDIDRLLGDK
jgi:hypothetical protein